MSNVSSSTPASRASDWPTASRWPGSIALPDHRTPTTRFSCATGPSPCVASVADGACTFGCAAICPAPGRRAIVPTTTTRHANNNAATATTAAIEGKYRLTSTALPRRKVPDRATRGALTPAVIGDAAVSSPQASESRSRRILLSPSTLRNWLSRKASMTSWSRCPGSSSSQRCKTALVSSESSFSR